MMDAFWSGYGDHKKMCPFRPLYDSLVTLRNYVKDEVHDDLHMIHHIANEKMHHVKEQVEAVVG